MSCDTAQERLDELALARALDAREASEGREHAAACADCTAHLAFLRALASSLDADATPPVAASVVSGAKRRAARVLRARTAPRGIGREVAAALAVAVLALPLVIAHAALVVEAGTWLLSSLLPEPLLAWLAVTYLASLAIAVGALYAAIPLAVAWRRRSPSSSPWETS